MKRIISLFLLAFSFALCFAAPAKRVTKTITVNGKQIQVTLRGNEKLHYWQSADGTRYRLREESTPAILSEADVQQALMSDKFTQKAIKESAKHYAPSASKAATKQNTQFIGQKRAIVILAQFPDKKFSFTDSAKVKAEYERILCERNYNERYQNGSVRDYFNAQSYGKFDFLVDVAGPYTLPNNMEYYGKNDLSDNDEHPGELIYHAIQAADKDVDFSKYDWDGDGEVELIYVIYAGYSEAQGASSNTVWPHAWNLEYANWGNTHTANQIFDGVRLDQYACSSELYGTRGKNVDGIGTICHELSHCFGLPDLYCTDNSHTELCMDEWSVLDHGCYGNDGFCPVSYTAYERWMCGWLEPVELNSPKFVKQMNDLNLSGDAYIIYNDAHKDEYYVLQNIQQTGWSKYSPGHGLLVIHVDYDADAWYYNEVNNQKKHLRVSPICADNKRGAYDLAGDTYPGTSNNTQLTDTSSPAATLFNKNADNTMFMGKPITDIAENDGVISFTFMDGIYVEEPHDAEAFIREGQIIVSWTSDDDDIASYNIRYGEYKEGESSEEVCVNEDFEKCKSTIDSSTDISGILNTVLSTSGFTGHKLFSGKQGLKMGSSKEDGWLLSPTISAASGSIRVEVNSEIYNTDNGKITISLYAPGALVPFYLSTPYDAGSPFSLTRDDIPDRCNVMVSASKRLYLSNLQIISNAVNPYQNGKVITGISAVPFSFKPDFEAEQYWVQVQAVNSSGKESDWSDYILVSLTPSEPSDPPSGIKGMQNADCRMQNYYNLNGQRVGKDYRGIVIRGGKKVITQ